MAKKQICLLVLSWIVSIQTLAADNLYSVFSVGYSDVEFIQDSNKGLGYKIAFGYQFEPQWYVEAGYQLLVHDSLYSTELPTANAVTNAENLQQGDALFIAFLGKASGRTGELFYRLGVLKTDVRGQQLLAGGRECEFGKANVLAIADFGAATLCDYDESGVAGVIGLGFDYFVGARTMIRTEIEYIKGQDNLSTAAATVGLRYNF
ncbi:outer membrane beta-barrel protein [Paraglaciecola arctica]|uniref:outer membrane beta-barrel protein n=1 Tax=Paraglaciecola arctica TaxID=1128911 RepID=UPI001C068F84|nr:outer membrane beta-barrel protein [Paraglaciecola arctica]